MNEKDFSEKLRPWLDRSAEQVGELQAARLRAARLKALDAYRPPVSILGLVTVGGGGAATLRQGILPKAILLIPVLILAAMFAIQSAPDDDADFGEIDAQLLSQELPPDAFLDTEFKSWLGKTHG